MQRVCRYHDVTYNECTAAENGGTLWCATAVPYDGSWGNCVCDGFHGISNSVEEDVSDGSMYVTSSDLELMADGTEQIVGVRFPDLQIPVGAVITEPTHLVFQVDEVNAESSEPVTIAIYADAGESSVSFSDQPFDVSKRTPTHHAIIWQPGTANDPGCEDAPRCGNHNAQCVLRGNPWSCRPQCWATPGCTVATPDLSKIVQEVASAPSWNPGDAVTLVLAHMSGNGVRWVDADNRNAADGPWTPQLTYSYTAPAGLVDPPRTVHPVTETLGSADTRNNAEERVHDGTMYIDSSDLELMHDGDGEGSDETEQVVGIRFENVNIPNGAVVSRAAVNFLVDEVHDSTDTSHRHCAGCTAMRVVIAIYGEAADNSAPISDTAFDLSSRTPTTASAVWVPDVSTETPPCEFQLENFDPEVSPDTMAGDWCPATCTGAGTDDLEGNLAARGWGDCESLIGYITDNYSNPWGHMGSLVSTPNLAAIVEEITSRPGWQPGNALMVLFGHVSGAGVRWVESAEQDTPSLTYELMLTPDMSWSPGPGTTAATLDTSGMICSSFKGQDKGSLSACAYATQHDPECGTYFHCDRADPPCSRGCDCATDKHHGGDNCRTREDYPSLEIYRLTPTSGGGH